MNIASLIEIFTVKNFDEINKTFSFVIKNTPEGFMLIDFQVTEVKDGYILKSIIKEKSEWYGE